MAKAIDELGREAFAAYQAGSLESAEVLCRQILASRPRYEPASFLAGVIAGRRGQVRESEKLLRDAVAFNPTSARAHLHLASLLRQTGRLREAEANFLKTISLAPREAYAHNDLGLVYLSENRWVDAIGCFERALKCQPDFALAYYNLGIAQQSISRDGDAIRSFRRAAELAPDLAEAHSKLGNLLFEYGHHEEANASFLRAVSARPTSAIAELCSAKVHLQAQRLVEAEADLNSALAREPNNGDAWRLLGMILSQLGRFDRAINALEKAIELQPGNVAAYYDLIHAKKVSQADRPVIEQMRKLAASSSLSDRDSTSLHFALGKAFDDLGEYGRAIEHFDEANRKTRTRQTFDSSAHRASIEKTMALYGPASASRTLPGASNSDLPILIVGMMRSGTTLVEQILSSHPAIGAGGELSFWGDTATELQHVPPDAIKAEIRQRVSSQYIARLRELAPAASRVTDKMPHNFLWLGLIHSILPQARIIRCRRNPLDTCLSIYCTHFGVYKGFACDRDDIVAYYQEYERLMDHWRSVLPSDRLIEVDYEELVANREPVARNLIAFCGLDWDDACLRHDKNDRAVKTASLWQVRQPIYTSSVERWRHYEPWLGAFGRLAPGSASRQHSHQPDGVEVP